MLFLPDVDSRWLFTAVLAVVIVERLFELRIAQRNERKARARGGIEAGAGHYPVMVLLHTAFLAACLAEVWWFGRPWIPALALIAGPLLAGTMALRYWVIATLGERWNTRVLVVPGDAPVTGGPFRWLRHPNYLAVVVEMFALPLIHSAWTTAVVFSVANALLLRHRIRVEEAALRRYCSYDEVFAAQGGN